MSAPEAQVFPIDGGRPRSCEERAAAVAAVAAAHAASVDRDARFPAEALDALRAEGLLSAMVPEELGGGGASLREIAAVTRVLGGACASTAMVFAMHQIQVACLVDHGDSEGLRATLRRIAEDQLLLASATTELGVGGDVRSSLCAVEVRGERASVRKQAPVISYGATADAVLVTARRGPDSPPSDQVLICCERPALDLEATGEWETLGFRGTCSRGFSLTWSGSAECILPTPYGDISAQTMLPVSHILWASVWLGIAEAAALTAQGFMRGQSRQPAGPAHPSAARLAELSLLLNQFRSSVEAGSALYEAALHDGGLLESIGFAVSMNNLKVTSSRLVAEVVTLCLGVCGMAGYRIDSPYSLSRPLRDAHGAALMVSNDRINDHTAHLLLASKAI